MRDNSFEIKVQGDFIDEAIDTALEHIKGPEFKREVTRAVQNKVADLHVKNFQDLMTQGRELVNLLFDPERTSLEELITEFITEAVYQAVADEFKKV